MIAVSLESYKQWGCPHCGYRSALQHISVGGAASLHCSDPDCHRGFQIFAEGIAVSPIGIGRKEFTIYPELQRHPREGTPGHGSPDKQPEKGGEYFHSRGIGTDRAPCFVCGLGDLNSNIAAFVQCKDSGERIVGMFKDERARLDYREFEPDRVQVKIGACAKHFSALEKLREITQDGCITVARIAEAREVAETG